MLRILEPQPLATEVAYKKSVYRCNCQGNYTLFYMDKLCQNKQAEIGKKLKQIKKTFRVGSVQFLHGLYKYYGQELFSSLTVVPC